MLASFVAVVSLAQDDVTSGVWLRAGASMVLPTCGSRAWSQALAAGARAAESVSKIDAATPGAARPRVAVLIIGQLRSMYADWMVEQVLRQLVRPLGADVFLFVAPDRELWQAAAEATQQGFRLLSLEEVLARLRPVRYGIYGGTEHSAVERDCFAHPRHAAQFWPFPHAFELVRQHERERALQYDWVVRTRPDVVFPGGTVTLPLPPEALAGHPATVFGQAYYHGCLFCDQFQVATRSAADALFSVYDAFRACNTMTDNHTFCWCCHGLCHERVRCGSGRRMHGGDTECLMARHLRSRGVAVNATSRWALRTYRLAVTDLRLAKVAHLSPGPSCPSE